MKKKILLVLTSMMLAMSSFVGCNANDTVVSGDAPDYSKATGQLDFMTYSVPLPTDEQFQLYKEAGLRTMLMSGEYLGYYQGLCSVRDGVDLGTLEKFFQLADKYGVNILDFAMTMDTITTSKDRQAIYTKYPNVLKGFFIGDEPGVIEIDDMAKYTDWVNTNYPKATYTTTLHPSWAPVSTELDEGQGKVTNIEEYYKYMIDNVLMEMGGQKILCADDYPCKRYGYDGKNFLNTLLYMSKVAKNYPQVIKQMCLNCSTFREVNEAPGYNARPENQWVGAYEKVVTEMEIRMPAITSLAFGFKSFLYFMYGPFPHSDEMVIERESMTNLGITKNISPINYAGPNAVEKTEYYDYIKNTNLELESFEKCFTSFKWYAAQMISQSGYYSAPIKEINSTFSDATKSFNRLSSYSATGNADVVIGYFKEGKSREGYFVSNFCGYSDMSEIQKDKVLIYKDAKNLEYNKTATVNLQFKNYGKVYLVKNGVTITDKSLVNHTLKQELKPGDYMFVIPY